MSMLDALSCEFVLMAGSRQLSPHAGLHFGKCSGRQSSIHRIRGICPTFDGYRNGCGRVQAENVPSRLNDFWKTVFAE